VQSAKPLMAWIGTSMPAATSLAGNTSFAMKTILWDFTKASPLYRVDNPFSGAVPMHYVTTVL